MPTLKSAAKRMRQSARTRVSNLLVSTQIRNMRRALLEALDARKADESAKLFREYCALLDKSAKKGVIKKNTAIRRKARASEKLRALKAG